MIRPSHRSRKSSKSIHQPQDFILHTLIFFQDLSWLCSTIRRQAFHLKSVKSSRGWLSYDQYIFSTLHQHQIAPFAPIWVSSSPSPNELRHYWYHRCSILDNNWRICVKSSWYCRWNDFIGFICCGEVTRERFNDSCFGLLLNNFNNLVEKIIPIFLEFEGFLLAFGSLVNF